ncbi:unnamed protein product [Parajaminaea phylloscopi]
MAKVNDRSPLLGPRHVASDIGDVDIDGPRQRPSRPLSACFTLSDEATPSRRSSRYLQAVNDGLIRDNVGLLLLLCSAFLLSVMALSYTLLARVTAHTTHPVTPLQVIFARMLFTWIGSVGALIAMKDPHPFFGPPGVRLLLCLRGVIGFFGLFSFYFSLRYLSLSDATVITFLSPILTGTACFLFLGEPFTKSEMLAGVASLGGVLLIARPKSLFGRGSHDGLSVGEESYVLDDGYHTLTKNVTESQRLAAIGVALIGVCGAAGAFTTIRAIGTRASALHSVSFFGLYSTLVSLFLGLGVQGETWALPDEHRTEAAVLLMLCGGCGFAGQFLTAKGLQMCKGARATTISYTGAIWSSLFQVVFLHEPIAPLSALGCLIILSAALMLALNK